MSPRSVLVIGGGPAGLVTLRNLIELGDFNRVELVERRDQIGGVWYLDAPGNKTGPRWPSPAYPGLIGNVLPKFLSFAKFPFPTLPDEKQPFPTLNETHEYLKAFAAPYSDRIRLNTEVTRVEELTDATGWKVQLRDWNLDGNDAEEVWDAVVICVCWYDNPVWPDTEGLNSLREKGLAKHANLWRGPQDREGKRILIIGNANSSNDIATQLMTVARTPVYRSIRRQAFPGFVSLPDERIIDVAPVKRYVLSDQDKITAVLDDGTEITDIDQVEVGTGYRPYPSFVHVLDSAEQIVPLMNENIKPHRIPSLHRLILYSYNPSLAFIGTAAVSYTPFTIADVSSTWLSLAWRGEVPYPSTAEERLQSEIDRLAAIVKAVAETENPSSLLSYGVLSIYEETYAAGLKEDIVKARPELKELLPEWNPEQTMERELMFDTKRKALEYMKQKREATLE